METGIIHFKKIYVDSDSLFVQSTENASPKEITLLEPQPNSLNITRNRKWVIYNILVVEYERCL